MVCPNYILLARHGAVKRNPVTPDKDQGLSPEGIETTFEIAKALADTLNYEPEDKRVKSVIILHGSYAHTFETAQIFEQVLKTQLEPDALAGGRPMVARFVWRTSAGELNPDRFWTTKYRRLDEIHDIAGRLIGKGEPPQNRWSQLQRRNHFLDHFYQRRVDVPDNPRAPNARTKRQEASAALVVIGHQPQLGWIAEELLEYAPPIARSEIICIRLGDRTESKKTGWLGSIEWSEQTKWLGWWNNRLIWSIAPSDTEALKELRDKIRSKMDVAKVVGTFITGVFSFSVSSLLGKYQDVKKYLESDQKLALYAALILFLIAITLYFATIFAYDRLLMPPRFWAEGMPKDEDSPIVRRPPSASSWVLYQNMRRVWDWYFTFATYSVGIGLLSLTYAVFRPAHWISAGSLVGDALRLLDWHDIGAAVFLAIVLVFLRRLIRRFRPILGSED